ncbi:hypothetical protein PMAYCL1PPCAC_06805 [Pristionchus mayeri]|uniref:Bestrophin homolog n=1 Tax=Pristionchus mayeri TaxID=1317129 RepID=A0AAN4ZFA3_9BILA|nr:hypothetical protein PMAYCL1PPCAC_06805 [Pristionchus mayeri]
MDRHTSPPHRELHHRGDESTRILRRNLVRYLVLTQALVFRDVSACVKKRFPTMNHLVTAGLMTYREKEEFDKIDSPHIKYWQPMHWVFSLIKEAKAQGRISDIIFIDMLEKMRQFRVNVLNLTLYDWVSVPLGYTQVVHVAVRSYFAVALFGRQYLSTTRDIPMSKTIDLYVPIMTILQFMFFVGWMKVAEVLLNPLGEDDDDFECNYILDRNLQVGFSIVDDAYDNIPPQERDPFWDVPLPQPLYTSEAAERPVNPIVGSCAHLETDYDDVEKEAVMLLPRRRSTTSRTLAWDNTSDLIVPVLRDRPGSLFSVDSASMGASMRPNSKMRDLLRRMNGRNKWNSSVSSRQKASRSNSNVSSFPSMSRQDSVVSMTPSVISIEVQTEEKGEERTERGVDTMSPHWKGEDFLPVIMEDDERNTRWRGSIISQNSTSSQETAKKETKGHSTIEEANEEKDKN